MRSVRGKAPRRIKVTRSLDASLSRAIVVPPKSMRERIVLSFTGQGRRPRPVPMTAQKASRRWRYVAVALLGSAGLYGFGVGGEAERAYANLANATGSLAVGLGFGVKQVTVEGQRYTSDAELTEALEVGPETITLGFNTARAKDRLEQVPWIRHAKVMRLLPSTVEVIIEEREPFAVWQHEGRTYLIDSDGASIAPATRDSYPDLPFVVGTGAEKEAATLFEMLEPYPATQRQLLAAIRVGERRWTLKLVSGTEILLPDGDVEAALETLAGLERAHRLGANVAAVDLRLADRITLKLKEQPQPVSEQTTGSIVPQSPRSNDT